jgi:hypothetical protein
MKPTVLETVKQTGLGVLRDSFKRMDSWINAVTGLGTSRDKVVAAYFGLTTTLDDQTLEALYDDDLAARIVDQLPEDALRQGYDVKIPTDEDATDVSATIETEKAIAEALEDLSADQRLLEAWSWGRLFGGGVIYVLTDDPGAIDQELRPDQIRRIVSLVVIDKRDIFPMTWDTDPRSPTFGEPLLYQVVRTGGQGVGAQTMLIHRSRLIIFEGVRTTWRRKALNNGWSLSVLQRVHEALRQFGISWQAVAHRMQDWSQAVFKMDGLISMIASKGKDALKERMEIVDMSRSTARAILVDAEKEEFTSNETSFTGAADILGKMMLRMSAAAYMPATILFGQSPAGMDATGQSDQAIWDDRVKSAQEQTLLPRLERLVFLLLSSREGPTNGQVPDGWKIDFRPLRQMTEKEHAEIRKLTSDADSIDINAGVLTPEEVALSRYRATGYSTETKIDLELRKEVQEADRDRAIEAANNPQPEPVPGAPAPGTPEPQPPAEE